MKKAFENYTLLAGNHGMRGSLWRGPDHLLVIEGRGFMIPLSEHYKRIDFKNVQALSMTSTWRSLWLALLLGLGLLIFGGGILLSLTLDSAEAVPPLVITLAFPLLLFLTLLIVHLARGKTCRCAVQTAVQTLPLRPLTRTESAQKVLETLAQICREHQGELPVNLDDASLTSAPAPVVTSGKPMWFGSLWVIWTGALLVLWGGMVAAELFVPGMVFFGVNVALATVIFVTALISLVNAMRRMVPGRLLFSLWSTLALQVLMGLGAYFLLIILNVRESIKANGEGGSVSGDNFVASIADLSMDTTGPWGYLLVGLGLFLAALGLIMLIDGRRRTAPTTTSSMPPIPAAVDKTLPEDNA